MFRSIITSAPIRLRRTPGQPASRFLNAAPGTPSVNGLNGALLTANPNGVNPFRFSRAQAATCDQDHNYTDEQAAFHFGPDG